MVKRIRRKLHRVYIRRRVHRWFQTKVQDEKDRYNTLFKPILSAKDMERIAFKICLFNGLGSIWKKDSKEIGHIIDKYNLKSYVDKNYDRLVGLSIAEQATALELYIEKCSLIHGEM